MNQPITPSDRRRFPRVSVNFVTVEVYTAIGEPDEPEMCFVINLSENGMMLRSKKTYSSGQRVRLTFTLPESETVIRTDAVMIHSQVLESSSLYGVQFRNLGLAEHSLLRDFVHNFFK